MMGSNAEIVYVDKIVPDAYHGTELKTALKILRGKNFIPSRGKETYLGDGVYFYESSLWHARQWCQRRFPGLRHGVICAAINLRGCLDLHNYEHRKLLQQVRLNLEMKGYKKLTDTFLINFCATNIKEFDTVRWTYTATGGKYGKIYPGSRIDDFSQLIICVRNQESILSIELADEGG